MKSWECRGCIPLTWSELHLRKAWICLGEWESAPRETLKTPQTFFRLFPLLLEFPGVGRETRNTSVKFLRNSVLVAHSCPFPCPSERLFHTFGKKWEISGQEFCCFGAAKSTPGMGFSMEKEGGGKASSLGIPGGVFHGRHWGQGWFWEGV